MPSNKSFTRRPAVNDPQWLLLDCVVRFSDAFGEEILRNASTWLSPPDWQASAPGTCSGSLFSSSSWKSPTFLHGTTYLPASISRAVYALASISESPINYPVFLVFLCILTDGHHRVFCGCLVLGIVVPFVPTLLALLAGELIHYMVFTLGKQRKVTFSSCRYILRPRRIFHRRYPGAFFFWVRRINCQL